MVKAHVIQVKGPIILEWPNGMRLQLSPADAGDVRAAQSVRRGRKPSPATRALVDALQHDLKVARPRSYADYRAILRKAGHKSEASAQFIVAREVKRTFGHLLGRRRSKGTSNGRGGGRRPSHLSVMLREKLQLDKDGDGIREAAHYVRWLVDKANVGIKKARPVVYREIRAAK